VVLHPRGDCIGIPIAQNKMSLDSVGGRVQEAVKGNLSFKRDMGLMATFCLAALVMTWLSYSLPRFLPGDFVTATYGRPR
jgi:hypothetical protein